MSESNVSNDGRNGFAWSLKPLLWVARVVAGVSLNLKKERSIAGRLFFVIFGLLIFFANFLINGPRGIDLKKFYWMESTIKEFESPYLFFKVAPDTMLQFVVDVTFICFYVTVPLIHFIFLLTILLSKQFTKLELVLHKIQTKMKLDEIFHQKCRRYCIVALLLLFLVGLCSLFFQIVKEPYIFILKTFIGCHGFLCEIFRK